jgi:hypothetical protein
MVRDNNGTRDWAADYDGNRQVRAARDGGGGKRRRWQMTMVKADDYGGSGQQHTRLDGGYPRERTRAGGKRWQRQQSGNNGCGSGKQRWTMMMAAADVDGGGQR